MKAIQSTLLLALTLSFALQSCKKEPAEEGPKLIIKLVVDSTQERLGNDGSPATIPAGNAAQHPIFNSLSAHYIEFAPNQYTALGGGQVLYHAPEVNTGGDQAIDFQESIIRAPNVRFLEIPLSQLDSGAYNWVRLSLSYQNYDVQFYYNGQPYTGTLASFVGYNSYITDFLVKDQNLSVNANREQGFWAFESIAGVQSGQAPTGSTTVPNPLMATSPIPAGSCVVTGQFDQPLEINGEETEDITIEMSLSVNNSFEWQDSNGNGRWDVDNSAPEPVVDMGLRGLIPIAYNPN